MSTLRHYQKDFKHAIYNAFDQGARAVLGISPTGSGKTVVTGEIARESQCSGMFIAHRAELLAQISCQLAREGVYHDLITPKNSPLRRKISDLHLNKIGKNFINDRCEWYVGGVDTVKNMVDDKRWRRLGLMITDEAHHLLKGNKWGTVFSYAQQALLLGVTATPRRADRKGLGKHDAGVFDAMVEGTTMRELIDMGFLTDYRLLCPRVQDLDMAGVTVSSTTGDYNQDEMRKAIHKSSRIVGDVVRHYVDHANGKLGVTFAVDVEEACKIAAAFVKAGIPAEVVSAKTPEALRTNILERFEQRKVLQLVNVDLFGEGFDLPAIEVVSLARPTMSLALFIQQFGRALRLMISPQLMGAWDTFTSAQRKQMISESAKPFALIIDHVGNTLQHGYPDAPQQWSLDPGEKRTRASNSDAIPLRSCLNLECMKVYERSEIICPHCGEPAPEPTNRSGPDFVDGDLQLLTEEMLSELRGDIKKVDGKIYAPPHLDAHVKATIIRNHTARQVEQEKLRYIIAVWAGKHNEHTDRVNHKRFYLQFKITVLEAMALNVKEAEQLGRRIILTL